MAETSAQRAPHIFLSYASVNRLAALALADALEAAGVAVWLDRASIDPGRSWGEEIVAGIKACAAPVLLCSPAAMQSRNVAQEIQPAWRYERPYVPVLLEPVTIPERLQYFLEGWQWVELFARRIEHASAVTWRTEIIAHTYHAITADAPDERQRATGAIGNRQ